VSIFNQSDKFLHCYDREEILRMFIVRCRTSR